MLFGEKTVVGAVDDQGVSATGVRGGMPSSAGSTMSKSTSKSCSASQLNFCKEERRRSNKSQRRLVALGEK